MLPARVFDIAAEGGSTFTFKTGARIAVALPACVFLYRREAGEGRHRWLAPAFSQPAALRPKLSALHTPPSLAGNRRYSSPGIPRTYLQAPPLPPTPQAFDESTNRLTDDVWVIFRRWLALKFPPLWRPVATCGCCESMHCFTAISRSCCEAICTLLHRNINGFGSFRTLL